MGSTTRRVRPAVRGSGVGRGYVILPQGGLSKPIGEYDATTLAPAIQIRAPADRRAMR